MKEKTQRKLERWRVVGGGELSVHYLIYAIDAWATNHAHFNVLPRNKIF